MSFGDLPDLAATAPRTGPFPRAGFVGVWWDHRGTGDPLAVHAGGGALALVVDGQQAVFAGESDLTDYHSPLGVDPAEAIATTLGMLTPGTAVTLDSLPAEACDVLLRVCADTGRQAAVDDHTVAMVLDLPPDPEAYLASLDGKQRHEVRRKRRRFEEAVGTPTLERDPGAFSDFVRMHRAADGEKGSFLDAGMERFFRGLLDEAGAVVDVLRDGSGVPVAAAFGFEDDDTYYLYNSAFDPAHGDVSPGIVLVHMAIEATILAGRTRFDFLKGDETYKLRLGAVARPLFRIEVVA